MAIFKKAVLLPDIHYPDHDKKCLKAVLKFIQENKPDIIVFMGDQLTLDPVSFWNKGKPGLSEGKRLLADYQGFEREILTPIIKAGKKNCQYVWIVGNHENRASKFIQENPSVKGLIEPEGYLRLKERGFKVVEFGNYYELGKLYVMHGEFWNKYHAAKTVETFENSVMYAHTHNPQMYAKVVPRDTGKYHIAWCLPCLCNLAPDYKAGKSNRWINGFGVVYVRPDGYFDPYMVIINRGSFVFNDKLYGG
jgi:predicted phosphodiesterase